MIAVYHGTVSTLGAHHPTAQPGHQALQTLERYKNRLDAVAGSLSALEVEDLVTVRDVVTVLQRAEMVRRIAEEIHGYTLEWTPTPASSGSSWRSCWAGWRTTAGWSSRTTSTPTRAGTCPTPWRAWPTSPPRTCSTSSRSPPSSTCRETRPSSTPACSRGYRLLHKIPRLPEAIVERIVERFTTLPKILRATVDDLDEVEGVGESRARAIQEGLSRLAESSVLDRYG